jgi:thymidylate synthase
MNAEKKDIFDFTFDDFELTDYVAQPHIAAPIAV